MVVWLASFPRSGNTLVRVYLTDVYGLRCRSQYEERTGPVEDRMIDLLRSEAPVAAADLPALAAGPEPVFVKTHGLPADDRPALVVVRDGRDVLVSYAHFIHTFLPDEARGETLALTMRRLATSTDHFGGWSANVKAWAERTAGPTVVVRFEDLVASPRGVLDEALRRLGVAPPRVAAAALEFASLRARYPRFFRRGQVGAWRDEMPADVLELFWRHQGAAMRALGYA